MGVDWLRSWVFSIQYGIRLSGLVFRSSLDRIWRVLITGTCNDVVGIDHHLTIL